MDIMTEHSLTKANDFAETGNIDKAIQILKEDAQIHYNLNDYNKAIILYENANQLKPDDIEIHLALATCYEKENDYEKASDHLKESLRIARKDHEITIIDDIINRIKACENYTALPSLYSENDLNL